MAAIKNKNTEKSTFKARKGQIDYTHARWAPVINCVLKYNNKILVVQRSKNLNFYPNYWNGVSGFLDDQRSLNKKISDELKEELGIEAKEWLYLGFTKRIPNILDCDAHLFLAKKIKIGEPKLDKTEDIKTKKMKFEEAYKMVLESKIVEDSSCVLILKAKEFLGL